MTRRRARIGAVLAAFCAAVLVGPPQRPQAHVDAPARHGAYRVTLLKIQIFVNRRVSAREVEELESSKLFVASRVTAATHGSEQSAHGLYDVHITRATSSLPKATIRPARAVLFTHRDCAPAEAVTTDISGSLLGPGRKGKALRKAAERLLDAGSDPVPDGKLDAAALKSVLKPPEIAGDALPAGRDRAPTADAGHEIIVKTHDLVVHYYLRYDYETAAPNCDPGFNPGGAVDDGEPDFAGGVESPEHLQHDVGPAAGNYFVELERVQIALDRQHPSGEHRRADQEELAFLNRSRLFVAAWAQADTHGEQRSFHGLYDVKFTKSGRHIPRADIDTRGAVLYQHTDCAPDEPITASLAGTLVTSSRLRRYALGLTGRFKDPFGGGDRGSDLVADALLNPEAGDGVGLELAGPKGLKPGINELVAHTNYGTGGTSTLDIVTRYFVQFGYMTKPPACDSDIFVGAPAETQKPVPSQTPGTGGTPTPTTTATVTPTPTETPDPACPGGASIASGNPDGSHAFTNAFRLQGTCNFHFDEIELTAQGNVQFNGYFTVLHSTGCGDPTTTSVRCTAKPVEGNPTNAYEAWFETTPAPASGQSFRVRVFRGGAYFEFFLTIP